MSEQQILDMLPDHFAMLKEMREIARVEGRKLDGLYDSVDDLLDQMYIITATWGLSYWEERYLLPVLSEDTDYEKRRRRILTKKRSNKANLVDILKSIEPSIKLGWGGLVLPFYIDTRTDHYDFGELISILEVEKPSHLTYSFNLRPNGYTVKSNHNDRFSVALKLISGTAKAGRYPSANTRGESLHNLLNVIGQEITGVAVLQRSSDLSSGAKDYPSSFGVIDEEIIQIKSGIKVGESTFNRSGEYETGQILTKSYGSRRDLSLDTRLVMSTGQSSFSCGVRFSGEEVA